MPEPLIIHWDGRNLPPELARLASGRYIATPDDDLQDEPSQPFTALDNLQLGDSSAPAAVLIQLAQLAPIEEALTRAGIAYQVRGRRFYDRPEVRDAIGSLRRKPPTETGLQLGQQLSELFLQ